MITHANIFSSSANEYHANTGGPRSRTQTVQLHSSVLGQKSGRFGCALMITAAIDFGRADPVNAVERLMRRVGIDDTEVLRAQYQTIDQPCICRSVKDQHPPHIKLGKVDEVLRRVLILGLSTGYLYDPARPVLLTHASLTRHLTLYAGEGFYA